METTQIIFHSALCTEVLSFSKVEFWFIQLFRALKSFLVIFILFKRELDYKRILADFITITFLYVPKSFLLIAIKDMFAMYV